MIFYFSATGNNRHIAETLASKTGESVQSINECIQKEQYRFSLSEGEMLGIVTPTYFWGLPKSVCDFLERFEISAHGKPYCFYVASYGTTNGKTGKQAEDYLKAKGFTLDAKFSVKMPDTWTPIFDLSDHEKVRTMTIRAEREIDAVAGKIQSRQKGDFMKMKTPAFLGSLYYDWAYPHFSTTDHFTVTDSCVGCGLCAKNCPAKAINIVDGKPVWVKDSCAVCLGCLHNCPKFAIDYGKNTRKHGQYHYSDAKQK